MAMLLSTGVDKSFSDLVVKKVGRIEL